MKKLLLLLGLVALGGSGCGYTDIVRTKELKALDVRCVHIEPIQSENQYAGQVLRDVLQKEFIRSKVQLCDPNTATVLITGSAFMTVRSISDNPGNEAIESVSLMARDQAGRILLTASYDNKKQYTASKLAKEFGRAVAGKLR